jgi:hypothetical protein
MQWNSLMSATTAQVRTLRGEVALQQVRCGDHPVVAAPPLLARVRPNEPVTAHQPGDAVAADPVPAPTELTELARRPVGATRMGVDLPNLLEQRLVLDRTSRRGAGLPGVEHRPTHPNVSAQIRDSILGLMIANEPEADHRFVSRAK